MAISFNPTRSQDFGRYDVMFIPKNKQLSGILLEFKIAEVLEDLVNKAQEALDQIKDKQYMEVLRQHEVESVLARYGVLW